MKNKKGFTLVELLGVLVILAILLILISRPIIKMLDKSKEGISASQEKSILNAAEKWSIDNSDKFDDIEGSISQISADIVFILDISTSMATKFPGKTGNQDCRYYGMVEATNAAMEILSVGENRISVVFFSSGTPGFYEFLPLGKYSSIDNDFIKINKPGITACGTYNNDNNAIAVGANLKNYGNNYPKPVQRLTGSTNTQGGIIQGTQKLIPVSGETRIPVVVLLTDGEPNATHITTGDYAVCSSSSNSLRKAFSSTSYPQQYCLAVLAGAKTKATVSSAYGTDAFFYTIGLGLGSNAARNLLEPNKCLGLNATSAECQALKDNHYVTKAFVDSTISADELKNIFSNISNEVIEATEVVQVCVTPEILAKEGYLSTKDIKLADDKAAAQYVIMNYNKHVNQYDFNLLHPKTVAEHGQTAYDTYKKQVEQCEESIAAWDITP
jgi:prepilin-type N-terminal cleavage/methylation domain